VVALDKTGTLTAGALTLTTVITDGEVSEQEALRLAGAVEDGSEHPIGLAIAREAAARAVLVLADQPRPGAAEAVERLRRMGLRPVMLTGDREGTALAVAARLGIPADSVYAGTDPAGKAAVIGRLQAGGLPVAFAGDGVNDAAALAQADLGMAFGSAADVAVGAAGLTIAGGDPAAIADALQFARATMRVIRANLTWAFCYNLAAIPVAALGYLNPMLAGVAMSASSLIVVGNSLRLLRLRVGPPHLPPSPPAGDSR